MMRVQVNTVLLILKLLSYIVGIHILLTKAETINLYHPAITYLLMLCKGNFFVLLVLHIT